MNQYKKFFCYSIRHEISLWDYCKPSLHLTVCHSLKKCFRRYTNQKNSVGTTKKDLDSQKQLRHTFLEDLKLLRNCLHNVCLKLIFTDKCTSFKIDSTPFTLPNIPRIWVASPHLKSKCSTFQLFGQLIFRPQPHLKLSTDYLTNSNTCEHHGDLKGLTSLKYSC